MMLFLLPINYLYLYNGVKKIDSDAKALNTLGYIRGSIQRAVKFKDNNKTKNIFEKIDKKFLWLEKNYIPKNMEYFKQNDFITPYYELKSNYDLFCKNSKKSPKTVDELNISEHCWTLANQATNEIQFVSELKYDNFINSFKLRASFAIFIIILIFIYVIKNVRGKLEKNILKDPLTNIYNKIFFKEFLADQITKANKSNNGVCLLFIDIDHFKKVNDTYGHLVGDKVLIDITHILKRELRASDTLFRYGGEEFVIVANSCEFKGAITFASRLNYAIKEYNFQNVGKLTVSIGLASLEDGESLDSLVKRADAKMYEAKAMGRDMLRY